jgi:hypothetical protein
MSINDDKVFENVDLNTDRLKVPRGWLVRTYLSHSRGVSVHTMFLEDTRHTWKLKKEK